MPLPGLTPRMPALGVPPSAASTTPVFSSWNLSDVSAGAIIRGNVASAPGTANYGGRGTKSVSSGRYYLEFIMFITNGGGSWCGLANSSWPLSQGSFGSTSASVGVNNTGQIFAVTTGGGSIGTFSGAADICGIAWDAGTGSAYFAKNGIWAGGSTPGNGATPYVGATGALFPAFVAGSKVDGAILNTGGTPFFFGPPLGFQPWG